MLNKGKFLRSKSTLTGNSYNSSFEILNPLQIPSSGNYKFRFFTYINCPSDNCEVAKDFIKLSFKYDGEKDYLKIYENGSEFGRFQDKKWQEDTIDVKIINSTKIYVITRNIKRFIFLKDCFANR